MKIFLILLSCCVFSLTIRAAETSAAPQVPVKQEPAPVAVQEAAPVEQTRKWYSGVPASERHIKPTAKMRHSFKHLRSLQN